MIILVVLAHPDPESFNYSIARTAISKLEGNGHTVFFTDLYKEKFDPVLTSSEIPKNGSIDDVVRKHCSELVNADGIIIVHPNWWGQPPAILKGWIDRVMRPGVAYEFKEGDSGEGIPVGLLKAKTALVFNTSNTTPSREDNIFLDPLETLWKNCIFRLCGIENFYRKMYRIVVASSIEERNNWLAEVEEITNRCFPAPL